MTNNKARSCLGYLALALLLVNAVACGDTSPVLKDPSNGAGGAPETPPIEEPESPPLPPPPDTPPVTPPVVTPAKQKAGLVVRFDDMTYCTACVEFEETETSLTGFDLLTRAHITQVIHDYGVFGASICKLSANISMTNYAVGCDNVPSGNCFCDPTLSWAFFKPNNGAWLESETGASVTTVANGDVQGWSWTGYDSVLFMPISLPPYLTLAQICTAAPEHPCAPISN